MASLVAVTALAAVCASRSSSAVAPTIPIATEHEVTETSTHVSRMGLGASGASAPEVHWSNELQSLPAVSRHWSVEVRIRFDAPCVEGEPSRIYATVPTPHGASTVHLRERRPRFHLFRVERDGDTLAAYVDGRLIHRADAASITFEQSFDLAFGVECLGPSSYGQTTISTVDRIVYESDVFPCTRVTRANSRHNTWISELHPMPLAACPSRLEPHPSEEVAKQTVTTSRSGSTRLVFELLSTRVESQPPWFLLRATPDLLVGGEFWMHEVLDWY